VVVKTLGKSLASQHNGSVLRLLTKHTLTVVTPGTCSVCVAQKHGAQAEPRSELSKASADLKKVRDSSQTHARKWSELRKAPLGMDRDYTRYASKPPPACMAWLVLYTCQYF
jgi:hypothetical protein